MKRCPDNEKHDRFVTTAHVVQEWVVDRNGEFLEELGNLEVSHKPDRDNVWMCYECGAEAMEDER